MDKKNLRKEMKKNLASLPAVGKAFESVGKCMKFVQSETFASSKIIFGFMPMADEVDILPILRTALAKGKKVLVPRIIPDTNEMNFHFIEKDLNAETEINKWNIYEPKESLEKLDFDTLPEKFNAKEIVVLVPGLAFGKDLHRLGRGKGFYDVFLKKISSLYDEKIHIIGVCYEMQIINEVPFEEHDVSVTEML